MNTQTSILLSTPSEALGVDSKIDVSPIITSRQRVINMLTLAWNHALTRTQN